MYEINTIKNGNKGLNRFCWDKFSIFGTFCFYEAGTVDLPFNPEPIVIKQILNFAIFIYTLNSNVDWGVK